MNKLAIASLAALATAVVSTSANAAEKRWPNWYVGLNAGWSMSDDYDTNTAGVGGEVGTDGGYLLGASLGYVPPTQMPFFNMTRWEVEYTYRSNDAEAGTGDFEAHNLMGNMLVDFANDTRWTPYVGGGLGVASVDIDSNDDSSFAWQLMAGLDYASEAMPMTVWGLRYRYMDADEVDITNNAGLTTTYEYDAHSIEATARFRF